jgi:hypothetical protein
VAACRAAAATAGTPDIGELDRTLPTPGLPTAGHDLHLDHFVAPKQHFFWGLVLVQPPPSKYGTPSVRAPKCLSWKTKSTRKRQQLLDHFTVSLKIKLIDTKLGVLLVHPRNLVLAIWLLSRYLLPMMRLPGRIDETTEVSNLGN